MKAKIYLIVCAVLIVSVLGYSMCTKGVFTNHIYFPQNAYEELWNLLVSEGFGYTTVLETEGKPRYKAEGYMESLTFREPNAYLGWYWNDNLHIRVYIDEQPYSFIYDYATNTLYGEADETLLWEEFWVYYIRWCDESPDFDSRFLPRQMGTYTFQQVDSIRTVFQ